MRFRLGLVAATVALVTALVPGPARAVYRDAGALDAATPEVSWSGSFLLPTNPVDCTSVKEEPLCDHTDVHINAGGQDVEVVVTAATSGDELSLYVFDAAGAVVANSSTVGSTDRVVLESPSVGDYDIAIGPVLTPGGGGYSAVARLVTPGSVLQDPPACGSDSLTSIKAIAVPGLPPLPAPFVVDDGQPVSLDVRVVLDGVTRESAEATLAKVAQPYAWLGITVSGHGFDTDVVFTNAESGSMISDARRHYGGQRPPGSDVVLVITNRDISALGLNAVAGQADCISGVADPRRAFMVAEAAGEGAELVPDFAAKTTAHEMGHLLGGQHHFANCIEALDVATLLNLTPCTLMFNDVSLLSMKFSTLNGFIVRGHALAYARP